MDKTYGLNWLELIRRMVGCIIFLGLAGLFAWFISINPLALDWETFLSVAMLLFMSATSLFLLRNIVTTLWQNPRIQLQDHGITFITRGHEVDWHWDEFTHWSGRMTRHRLYGIITTHISGACQFLSDDKPALSVGGLCQDAPKLAVIIIQHVLNIQVPKQVAAFHQGQTLNFGTVLLNKESLHHQNTIIPFDDIQQISANRDFFWVHRNSQAKPARFAINDSFRAPDVLFAVVNTIAQAPPPTSNDSSV